MVDIRILIPVICIISIILIILAIVFRRAAMRRHGHRHRVRRVHPPHTSCATYTVPGCETIQAYPIPTYPQQYAPQPMYYHQNPGQSQQIYPQPVYPQTQPQAPYLNNQPPYANNQMPTSSQEAHQMPPPYYTETPKH